MCALNFLHGVAQHHRIIECFRGAKSITDQANKPASHSPLLSLPQAPRNG